MLGLDHPSLCNISIFLLSSKDPSPTQLKVPHRDTTLLSNLDNTLPVKNLEVVGENLDSSPNSIASELCGPLSLSLLICAMEIECQSTADSNLGHNDWEVCKCTLSCKELFQV